MSKQEQEARYAKLELEEDKFYDSQVIEEEHGIPNVDEDRQKGEEMANPKRIVWFPEIWLDVEAAYTEWRANGLEVVKGEGK